MENTVLFFDCFVNMNVRIFVVTYYMWDWLCAYAHACMCVCISPLVPYVILFCNVGSRHAEDGRQDGAERVSAGELISGVFTYCSM